MHAEDVAAKVANRYNELNGTPNAALDGGFLGIILELLLSLLGSIGGGFCGGGTPAGALRVANEQPRRHPRWSRLYVRMHARRKLGWRAYRQYGNKLVDAVLDSAKNATIDDVETLYKVL